jgi:polyisoprenoid-binding protein YceI
MLSPPVTCRVFAFKAGALSAMGHDLELVVDHCTLSLASDLSRVEATFDPASLRVVAPASLNARDRAKIEATIQKDVLKTRRHPLIRFTSTRIDEHRIEGTLELHGASRTISAELHRDGDRTRATVSLNQPSFGITPYSAMLGALRVQPDVRVVVEVKI